MPTNDERREVAAELRKLAAVTAYVHLPGSNLASLLFSAIHNGTEWDVSDRNPDGLFLARLADLIEPEERTCRIYDTDHGFEDSIRCDACQMTFRRPWQPFKFCPNCGARVIQE